MRQAVLNARVARPLGRIVSEAEDSREQGVNSLTILESEMAHWRHKQEGALNELAGDAMTTEESGTVQAVLDWEQLHPQMGSTTVRKALLMAADRAADVLDLVQQQLIDDPTNGEAEVLGMYLAADPTGAALSTTPPAVIARLQELAEQEGTGQIAAQTWLRAIGLENYPELIILPNEQRAVRPSSTVDTPDEGSLLTVYPNPAKGKDPVYIVVRLLVGMDRAALRVMDPMGRLVVDEQVTTPTGIVEVKIGDLAAGTYVAGLFADGLQVSSVKFQVIR